TKADPQQPTAPDLTTSLAKLTAKVADLDKRTIGFIREQEKTYLKPMLAQVQALQQVSSTPAPAQLSQGELRPAQVQELYGWYARMLRRLIVPSQLAPKFQAETLPPAPAKGQEDPALATLKNGLFGILRLALQPDLLTPAATSVPAAPVVPPPTRPA
ncbi:BfmA/BtgA family mobilization protein, partial [Hymenobacter cavernae]|uniref:BfmA/BtgA family mobilization protein n=1 Tax=Hymenobacter cavernae TaxID=2044852 RepID=UPI0027E57503